MPTAIMPPAHRQLLEDGHLVAHLGQPQGRRQAGRAGADDGHLLLLGRALDWPASTGRSSSWSAMKRLTARMAIGSSMSPRRQRCSQKAGQTRPQTRANGFVRRWISSPSA